MSGTAETARWADRIPGSSRILGVKAFEDEDSLPDVAFGTRRLAALAVSEVGTTKDDYDYENDEGQGRFCCDHAGLWP